MILWTIEGVPLSESIVPVTSRRTTRGASDDPVYVPLRSVSGAATTLQEAVARQNATDYYEVRAAMDAEYYWRAVVQTFQIADESFLHASRGTQDGADISAHVMARAADWVAKTELAVEGTRMYGALVAFTQGVGDGYAAVESWAEATKRASR